MNLGVARSARAALAAWRGAAAGARAALDPGEAEPAAHPAAERAPPAEPGGSPDNLRNIGSAGVTYIGSEREAPDDQPASPPAARRALPWRLLLVLVLPVVIAGLGAYVVAAEQDEIHAARSEVVFDLRDLSWSGAERFLSTQAVIVQSRMLLTPIAAQFQIPTARLEEGLSAATVDDSGVLRIEWQGTDAFLALDVVKAITERYLITLRQFEQREGGSHRLLTPAYVLEEPVGPKPLRAAAIGAVAGLILAIGAIFVRYQAWSSS